MLPRKTIGSSALAMLVLFSGGFKADRSPSPTLLSVPSWGLQLSAPSGWQEIPPDKYKTIAQWISPDSSPDNVKALIQVEGGKAQLSDADATAQALARDWGGKVAQERTSLDGEPAWRVQAEPAGYTLRPVEGIVTIHSGFLYLIMAGAKEGSSCHEQVESIRKSWKWLPLEQPAKHLEFRDHPIDIFDNTVSVNFPALMHTYATKQPDRVLDLGMSDIRRNEPDFLAYVQLVGVRPADSFAALQDKLAKGMQEKLHTDDAPTWREVKGPTRRAITRSLHSGASSVIWGLIQLDARRVVLINFTITTEDAAEASAFSSAAENIVKSVKPLAAAGRKS